MKKEFTFDLNEYLKIENNLYDYLEERYGGDKIFDLNSILPDRELFKSLYDDIYHILLEGFEIEKIRKFPVKVFFNKKEGMVEMEKVKYLLSLYLLWQFFI